MSQKNDSNVTGAPGFNETTFAMSQLFVNTFADKLPDRVIDRIADKLEKIPFSINQLSAVGRRFRDPVGSILLSIFTGVFGIDRFYIGDVGNGIGKLITCGGLGIWTIIDWFRIMKLTKKRNLKRLNQFLDSGVI